MRQDGALFRASGVLTVLRDESSQVIGFAKVMRDVSAREEARERMEQSLRERTTLLRESSSPRQEQSADDPKSHPVTG